ncbi:MAG TPA: monofunctional biosynthetic peptidoglycan transglycosylase [Pusillimonas sp.]|uniref:monofunctional biosynthetic peptidoglycan transglycosylase n=1 Tax=Pusillimonas sp. TaxID=3040095 RepID=UPI002BC9A093|nr:monofunctional biosynthetic peptidoglycan transglycosylase [Pusillimonas sp.]HUH88957.1 monofunctional biosynthetic peptidoglycan transglycosylase [Pusillimonas sp.]
MAQRRISKLKVAFTALLLAVFGFLLYQFGLFVMVVWLCFYDPSSSAFMKATRTDLRRENPDAVIRYQWVPYEKISNNLKRAVIASEDSRFMDHAGVEWRAIRKAWEYNMRQAESGGDRVRGGSTITQQLAKNLFLSSSRSYWRKGQELLLTYMIESVMSKQRILELYLNLAQWGVDVFGAQAAAAHYYRSDAARLGASQAARLAAMLPNPAYYDQRGDTAYLRSRTATIQKRMRQVEIP